MKLIKLIKVDGSWQRMVDEWTRQCGEYGETFDSYASATMPVLEALAGDPKSNAAVYATETGGSISSICQLNCTPLPGYDGPVLRLRMLTISPRYDLGDVTVEEYGAVLIHALSGVINLSNSNAMNARHIKFHLRSPSDRAFFQALGQGFEAVDVFASVKTAGSWLYIAKR